MRKLKKGKISQHDFDVATGLCEGGSDDEGSGKKGKKGVKQQQSGKGRGGVSVDLDAEDMGEDGGNGEEGNGGRSGDGGSSSGAEQPAPKKENRSHHGRGVPGQKSGGGGSQQQQAATGGTAAALRKAVRKGFAGAAGAKRPALGTLASGGGTSLQSFLTNKVKKDKKKAARAGKAAKAAGL